VTPTVDELRDEIRLAVGRYERVESTAFTKESLAAICDALGHEVDTARLPPKSQMRASILREIGEMNPDDPDPVERSFRKAELEAIAAAVDGDTA
jgi:hypothetical protein